jgi:hypothetical protein
MPLATNFAGAAFKVTIDVTGDTDPKVKPDFALTAIELLDPGFRFVSENFVATTDSKILLFSKMS